eukprot:1606930-Amphidinium_carterae.1
MFLITPPTTQCIDYGRDTPGNMDDHNIKILYSYIFNNHTHKKQPEQMNYLQSLMKMGGRIFQFRQIALYNWARMKSPAV